MVKLTIDGIAVQVNEGATILEAAKQVGINIPTLCYLKEINEIAACRVCVVEIKGVSKLAAACNTKAVEGMEVLTNSPKVRKARKANVELILSQHDCNCAFCVRNGNCALQSLSAQLGITSLDLNNDYEKFDWEKDFPLIRNASKCIKCMRCIQVCDKVQNLHVWDVTNTGARTTVVTKGGVNIKDSNCSLCGQCITHCPVGALYARDDVSRAFEALADEDKITVVQIAPATRGAWGKEFGLDIKDATAEKMVSAIRAIGVDYVFDTNFSADLTIMEEASEFLERISSGKEYKYPMFTSCCPGWVRFIKSQYPELVENLSSAKSPQQMFGAVIKSYFAQKLQKDPSEICVISVMPCVAKKHEADIPELADKAGNKNVDIVLTTRELARMIKAEHIDVNNLPEGGFDTPFGTASGAGVIFGTTGGVMEAALRTAYNMVCGENADINAFSAVRGENPWKEAQVNINGTELKVAVVSGLGNTRSLIDAIKAGKVKYDFVEVMACPGGCANGGGQPISFNEERGCEIGLNLRALDEASKIRYSHENPDIQALYSEFLEKPLSERSHEYLHTHHTV